MDSKRIQDDEYILQYYQISAPAIVQYMFNVIIFVIKKFLQSTEEEFAQSCPARKTLCSSVFDNLYKEYINRVVDVMEHREHELRDLLKIPSHMLLPEDKYRSKEYSEEKLKNLKDEINELENVYIKKKAFTYICEKELEILEQLQPLSERVNDIISKVGGLQRSQQTKLEKLLGYHNKITDIVMEKLFSDVAELKFAEFE